MTEPQLVPKTTADAVVEAIIAATMPAAVKEDFSEYARSGIASMYLGEQTVLVLGRTVDWESYQRANMLTAADVEAIRRYDKQSALRMRELVDGASYIALLLELLQKISRADTVQYLLAMLDEAVQLIAGQPAIIRVVREKHEATVFSQLLKLVQKDDEYCQLKAAKIIGEFLSVFGSMPRANLDEYLRWSLHQLPNYTKTPNVADLALQCVQCVLRVNGRVEAGGDHYRNVVYKWPGAIVALLDVLKNNTPTPQMQYHVITCLWMLSFVPEAAADLQRQHDIVGMLVDTLKSAVKEKVIRVCLSALRNMLDKAFDHVMLPMVGHKLATVCESLLGRKWSDEDIKPDLEFLKNELDKHVLKLSTWDEYQSEVRSGRLEWTPVHTNDGFWKANVQRLNDKNFELLRLLSRILVTSTNPVVLAVACHDIGQYSKWYPQGKKYVQDIGAKQQVMELMTHESAEVRYHALAAVQNYMSNAWDF